MTIRSIESICIWDGKNFIQIIQIIATKNEEMKVRIKGKKLVIKDTEAGFYRCIPIGDLVEIPKYEPKQQTEEVDHEPST